MASFPMIINGQKVMTQETTGVINPQPANTLHGFRSVHHST